MEEVWRRLFTRPYQNLGKQAAELIPNAHLYTMEGLGHLPHIEDFERFKPLFIRAITEYK
jgi:pimeloyl-ACP methyl ester carboxylesterase